MGSTLCVYNHVDKLVQERCNSIANALELRLSHTNPSIFDNAHHLYRIAMTTWPGDLFHASKLGHH